MHTGALFQFLPLRKTLDAIFCTSKFVDDSQKGSHSGLETIFFNIFLCCSYYTHHIIQCYLLFLCTLKHYSNQCPTLCDTAKPGMCHGQIKH
jgi:hypothetical protein